MLFMTRGLLLILIPWLALLAPEVLAHGVAATDAGFLESLHDSHPAALAYLGAKHMFTGYDHILFLLGVVFFLKHGRDVLVYASLFALGHSITLLGGALGNLSVNAYLIDALIGLSVVYKAYDNIQGLAGKSLPINPRWAVFGFGLVHGFGLATKLQELSLSKVGLVTNIISFNVGVELGQLAALGLILVVLNIWRKSSQFMQNAYRANLAVMIAGFVLMGYQLTGYFISQ